MDMIPIAGISIVRAYLLDITFSDGTTRRVDVAPLLWGELFEPLKDPAYFERARFDPEIGTVAWANEADIAPEYLSSQGVVIAAAAPAAR